MVRAFDIIEESKRVLTMHDIAPSSSFNFTAQKEFQAYLNAGRNASQLTS